MRCLLSLILLVLIVQSANGQDQEANKYTYLTIGKNRTVTLLLQHERDVQYGSVDVDPTPNGFRYTDSTTLTFNEPVEVRLTLTNLTAWRLMPCYRADAPKLVLSGLRPQIKLAWMVNENINETWTEVKSDSCPYLYVNRTNFSNSFKVSQLILNKTVIFNANSVAIQLTNVSHNEWCAIHIQFTASLLPANYCQNEDQFHCNESLQCLNVSTRCDGNRDCDLGEDELNCPQDATTETMVNQTLIYGVVGFIVTLLIAVVIVAICIYLKQRRNRQRQRNILRDKETHVYDYPTFSAEAYPLSMRESSEPSKNVETDVDPPPRTYTVTYDTSGVYSRVITASHAK